jgi:hypothetical protein
MYRFLVPALLSLLVMAEPAFSPPFRLPPRYDRGYDRGLDRDLDWGYDPGFDPDYVVDDATLVRGWIRHFLHRPPSRDEVRYWADQLRQGTTPEETLSTLLSGREYYQRAGGTTESFIFSLYVDLFGRGPTRAEVNSWSRSVMANGRKAVVLAILSANPDLAVQLGSPR